MTIILLRLSVRVLKRLTFPMYIYTFDFWKKIAYLVTDRQMSQSDDSCWKLLLQKKFLIEILLINSHILQGELDLLKKQKRCVLLAVRQ